MDSTYNQASVEEAKTPTTGKAFVEGSGQDILGSGKSIRQKMIAA